MPTDGIVGSLVGGGGDGFSLSVPLCRAIRRFKQGGEQARQRTTQALTIILIHNYFFGPPTNRTTHYRSSLQLLLPLQYYTMHPPLDRPHPMCQETINALKHCHATSSKLKFWACNEVKFAMDKCFRKEKESLLVEMNADFDEKRKREDEALRVSLGHKDSFEDFLKTDKQYLKEMQKAKHSTETFSDKAFS